MPTDLILGWEAESDPQFGFDVPRKPRAAGKPISYAGDGPITVIAPTGAGKGVNFLIPVLLTHPGALIVLDLKGELSAVTARRRAEMGQQVAILDPFAVTRKPSGRLNPFDLFELEGALLEPDAEMLASQLSDSHAGLADPYWIDTGSSLVAGLIAYAASVEPPDERSLSVVRKLLSGEDADYNLAMLLDTQAKTMNPFAYAEIGNYLQIPSDKTRPCVLSVARTLLKALNTDAVAACLENSTFSLEDVMNGEAITIYLTIPPEKLKSHRFMLRLWITVLLTAIQRRRFIPEQRTLLLLDEAAQLGKDFDPLLTAATLMRGYGMQLVTAWQDLAQIKSRYPNDWPTILNNSAATLSFGFGHYAAAKDYAEVLGVEPSELLKLKADEAMLALRGEGARKIRRLNYLKDPIFAGMSDKNPYYGGRPNAEMICKEEHREEPRGRPRMLGRIRDFWK